ncbi:malate dehydrogenase, mitochondrial [Neodiprion pinetum]|uniref:malate dehydrogenase, mitochondrial n=1 Tax=Neodiprion pinetum TaxID=441929 RepID=UPI001EDFA5CF|nr:malate dehydrogenase, mitochondrial-like [Neodiprion pinetum]
MFGAFRKARWNSAVIKIPRRYFRTTVPTNSKVMKVAILGAAGRTGRCLALLLKRSSIVDELAIYDILPMHSLALELNHVDARCKVNGYSGPSSIHEALRNAKVVIITAGQPEKLKRNSEQILKPNAKILSQLIPHLTEHCPRAMLGVVTSPVNVLIPMIAELYKKSGLYELNNIFGVTTLDCVRSNTFAAEILGLPPEAVVVPVIGGSCARTCVPLFSHIKPSCKLTNVSISGLSLSVKSANEKLMNAYDGSGTPSLSMAFAAARFCVSLCKGLRGLPGVVECAYVRSCVVPEVTYFASPLQLGPDGVQKNLGVPPLTDYECKMLNSAIPLLKTGIKIGENLALGSKTPSTEVCPTDPTPCPSPVLTARIRHPNPNSPIPAA